jgi:hypothetical protein
MAKVTFAISLFCLMIGSMLGDVPKVWQVLVFPLIADWITILANTISSRLDYISIN